MVSPKRTSLPSVLPTVECTPAGDDGRVVGVLGVAGEPDPGPEDQHHGGQQGGAVADAPTILPNV